MRMPVRRALIAAIVTALALPSVGSAASAACVATICDDDVFAAVAPVACQPICLDELYARMLAKLISEGGGSDNMLCAYAKLYGEPPTGWGGDPNDDAPYIWVETAQWGYENRDQYDYVLCIPACSVDAPTFQTSELFGSAQLTVTSDLANCAGPLVP